MGQAFLNSTFETNGELFLIELDHLEGEFKVGLGRRTFSKDNDDLMQREVEVEWFERCNRRQHAWGDTPTFQLTVRGYDRRSRQSLGPVTSVEPIDRFLPVEVSLTKGSDPMSKPRLMAAVTAALRGESFAHLRSHDVDFAIADRELPSDDDTGARSDNDFGGGGDSSYNVSQKGARCRKGRTAPGRHKRRVVVASSPSPSAEEEEIEMDMHHSYTVEEIEDHAASEEEGRSRCGNNADVHAPPMSNPCEHGDRSAHQTTRANLLNLPTPLALTKPKRSANGNFKCMACNVHGDAFLYCPSQSPDGTSPPLRCVNCVPSKGWSSISLTSTDYVRKLGRT